MAVCAVLAALALTAAAHPLPRWPRGTLPFPWRLKNQTATFYKPAHPERSAFRIEPIAGA